MLVRLLRMIVRGHGREDDAGFYGERVFRFAGGLHGGVASARAWARQRRGSARVGRTDRPTPFGTADHCMTESAVQCGFCENQREGPSRRKPWPVRLLRGAVGEGGCGGAEREKEEPV